MFLFGFAKSAKDNIADDELNAAKTLASAWLELTDAKIDQAIKHKQLIRVRHDDEEEDQHAAPEPLDAGDGAER